jgi:hypothetical protein
VSKDWDAAVRVSTSKRTEAALLSFDCKAVDGGIGWFDTGYVNGVGIRRAVACG